jgi:hypothetical protein
MRCFNEVNTYEYKGGYFRLDVMSDKRCEWISIKLGVMGLR